MDIPIGIANIGNTCYMNSILQVLQVLFNNSLFMERDVKLQSKQPLLTSMRMFSQSDAHPKDASNIKRTMAASHTMMRGFDQQDAHEFLLTALNDLNNELRHSSHNEIKATFGGEQQTSTKCLGCQNTTTMKSEFIDLPAIIPKSKNINFLSSSLVRSIPFIGTSLNHKLIDCLTESFKTETISDYKCSSCNKVVDCERSTVINNSPEVLIIHLQRFTPMLVKLNDVINIPFTLSLSKFEQSSSSSYRLFATVNHFGTFNFGHYTAIVNNQSNGWYTCDDSQILEMSQPQGRSFSSSDPYLLFYKKVSNN